MSEDVGRIAPLDQRQLCDLGGEVRSENSGCLPECQPVGDRRAAKHAASSPELDHAIIAYLKQRPRAPHTAIGKALGTSADVVGRSIECMKRTDALRIVAASHRGPDQLPRMMIAQICAKGQVDGLENHISAHPHAMSVYQCTGPFQLIALFRFDDMDQLSALGDYIALWPEPIGQIRYSFALEVVKFDMADQVSGPRS